MTLNPPVDIDYPAGKSAQVFAFLARFETWFSAGVILLLAAQIITQAQHTFNWRYGEDVGFFYYFSWLVNEKHYLPYRDLHETSFPGSFILYSLITRAAGYSVLAYNITHMIVFCALSAGSYAALKPLGKRFAIVATLVFGSTYFFMHHSMYMQRDFLVLLFVIFAIATMVSQLPLLGKSALSGILFGIAASIKPHAALAAPVIILTGTLMHQATNSSVNFRDSFVQCLQTATASLLGFSSVWLAIAAGLIASGSWPYFYNMLTEYMPLYQKMNGVHIAMTDAERWKNATDWFIGSLSGPFYFNCIFALTGLCFCWKNTLLSRTQKIYAAGLFLTWPIYLLYVSLGGKFWDYHQIPSHYFGGVIYSFFFITYIAKNRVYFCLRILFFCLVILVFYHLISPQYSLARACLDNNNPLCDFEEKEQYQIEDTLEKFFRHTLKPGERVEPLATSTLGPLFPAMLRAGIEPATPYLEGFPLYHDADTPYVQNIRADMLQRMQKNPPRFLVRPVNFFAPGGSTASRFDELESFIQKYYEPVSQVRYPELGNGLTVTIYELKKT